MAAANNNDLYAGGLNDAYGSRDSAQGASGVNDLHDAAGDGHTPNALYAQDNNDAYGDS